LKTFIDKLTDKSAIDSSKLEPLSEREEKQLIKSIAIGNKASFSKLMRLYQVKIRSYARIYTEQVNEHVDDLAQDIFLQIYQSCDKFQGKSKVSTWIFSIAKYTMYNKIRKKKLLYFWKFSSAKEIERSSNKFHCHKDGSFYYESEENKQLIQECLSQLKPHHQEILALYEFAELNYEQISNVLNLSIGTVKSRIFNGRKALAKIVSKHYE